MNVGGSTADSVDFNHQLRARAPLVFAFVLGLAFLLLMWSFRSIVIAGTGVVLNVLSVGAAYGVLVAVFQWGWGRSLLGLTSTGAITSWLPLFLFVILLGLSMDYHVFTVSPDQGGPRPRSADRQGDPRRHRPLGGRDHERGDRDGRVFLTFATLDQTSLKQLGVGLAVAVLLDATIVRAVLLPATMKLLGERNWYLPQGPVLAAALRARAGGRPAPSPRRRNPPHPVPASRRAPALGGPLNRSFLAAGSPSWDCVPMPVATPSSTPRCSTRPPQAAMPTRRST